MERSAMIARRPPSPSFDPRHPAWPKDEAVISAGSVGVCHPLDRDPSLAALLGKTGKNGRPSATTNRLPRVRLSPCCRPVDDEVQRRGAHLADVGIDEEPLAAGRDVVAEEVRRGNLLAPSRLEQGGRGS